MQVWTGMRVLAFVLALAVIVSTLALLSTRAGAQILTPRAGDLRFQLLSSEPMSTPDGRGAVAGSYTSVIKDVRSGRCFALLAIGETSGVVAVDCAG